MPDRLAQIHARRLRLVARAEVQRDQIAHDVAALGPAVRVVDRGVAAVTWLRANPGVLVIGAGVMLVLRPRRTLRWSLRAFSVWQAYRRITARLDRAVP
jgi:hypothetical protein